MTGRSVPEGALYYASSKRRRVVAITPELRALVASDLALEARR
jgi:CRISPR-associated exonuclease Cas4